MASGRNLMYRHNVNLINPIGLLADAAPSGAAPSCEYTCQPNLQPVNRVETGANSSFNALVFNYTHNFTRGIQENANYTWSRTLSTVRK